MIKRYLLPSLICLGLGLGLAYAQNVNRGVQLSQDATGPVGYDNIQGGVYLPGHLLSTTRIGPAPVLSACVAGTGGSFQGTDFAGVFTQGNTAATSCVLTFGTAFQTAPSCNVSWNTGPLAAMSWTTSTTALTITQTSATTSRISYTCTSTG
jgi:hypothetical protein